jgi:hypothetical protein
MAYLGILHILGNKRDKEMANARDGFRVLFGIIEILSSPKLGTFREMVVD